MPSKTEREALLTFIYRHTHGGLTGPDEAALRALIAPDYPEYARTLDAAGLVSLAGGIIGAAAFIKALEAAEARAEA